jgi:alanyl aminopeptidase
MRFAYFVAFVLCVSSPAFGANDSSTSFRLGDDATPVDYVARLAIDPGAASFAGEVRIAFRVNRALGALRLNAIKLKIESARITQADRTVDAASTQEGEEVVSLAVKDAPLAPGDAVAVIRYSGPIDPVTDHGLFQLKQDGEAYAVTQHEATDARRTFPCFDEPQWKTPWQLTIDAPARDVVVSNTPELRAAPIADRAGWTRHEFARTKPLPSYLIALGVGPFDVVDGGTAGRNRTPLRYIVPKGRTAEARYAREVTPRLLELLEEYFGIPYPFEKLDHLALPGLDHFGAMENVGLITYGANLLLATPREETVPHKRSYASVSAHEMAHMWFGDLVTTAWWDDIWLNEAFASWMANKVLYRFNPAWDTGERRTASRSRAIELDRLASTRRVHNPVNSHNDLGGAFDSITYQKGSVVLEMFELALGPENFRKGVQEFLRRHAYGSATSRDFFQAIADASGRGDEAVKAFSAFIEQPGVPLIDARLRCAGGKAFLDVEQQRLRPVGSTAAEMSWDTPACVRIGKDGKQCASVENGRHAIALRENVCPSWVLGNADGTGYYVVRYDAALLKRMLAVARALPAHEAAVLVADSALLHQSGLVSNATALDVADAAFRNASPVVQLAAVRLLKGLRDEWLDARELRRKQGVIDYRIQPLARAVGWQEKAGESDEVRDLRIELLPYAAERAGGEPLRAAARELAQRWLHDRDALPAAMVKPMLETAARFADAATFDALVAAERDSRLSLERARLQKGLAKVREPALRARAFALALDADLDGQEALVFVSEALEDEHNRDAAFAFLRANFDALVARLPEDSPGRFARDLKDLCTASDRATFVTFFDTRVDRFRGGRHQYDQALEAIDLCIAAHKRGNKS